MQILLLRHGIADEARAGQPDSERALTGEGREKLRRVLRRAKGAEVAPDVILSSPYRRAIETAEEAAEVLGYKGKIVRTTKLTPDTSPFDAWEEIRERYDGSVLLASHEPLMSAMTAFLLNSPALQVDMKKGAMVRVDCGHSGPRPHGVLKWMITPAMAEE